MPSGRCVSILLVALLLGSVAPSTGLGLFESGEITGTPTLESSLTNVFTEHGGAPIDVWNESPFRDVAVPGGFNHQNYADYTDVAIIINNQSSDSRIIGYAFAAARSIPPERIFLLTNESTPTSETITPEQYDDFFAQPISDMIQNRTLSTIVNVLVTTKGVPLRVSGGTNARASFDSELSLLNSNLPTQVHAGWWGGHNYGPWDATAPANYAGWTDEPLPVFSRVEQDFYIVTRLTGYDVETALGLIDKANSSLGSRGLGVLDLATNRNSSGYKYWNDALYLANMTWNETLQQPVFFNQNSTFVTDQDDVMYYASWGSNDGSWGQNHLPNAGFDTADIGWTTGARYWSSAIPTLAAGESFDWTRQTEVSRNGAAALAGIIDSPCSVEESAETAGLLAEYFDNSGLSYNGSLMPDLSSRTADYQRPESDINQPSTLNAWGGLDSRFEDYWSVRYTGAIIIPESGNWTFYLDSDDGTVLWIDEVEVVNNQGIHSMSETSNSTWLDAGPHRLRTEFFEHGAHAGYILSWSGPNQTKQVIPASAYTRGTGEAVVLESLVHHWAFDETNGTTGLDSAGTGNLTIYGGGANGSSNNSSWQPCLFDNCLALDGVDDYASVDVSDWGGNFSVSLWLKTENDSQDRYSSVFAVNNVAGDDASFQIMASGGANGNWEAYHNTSYSFGAIEAGVWTHLVIAFENNSLLQYMNGDLVSSTPVPNSTIDSIELYKMGVNRAGTTYYQGLIDDVRVWNRTITAAEVVEVAEMAAVSCTGFSGAGNSQTSLTQSFDFSESLEEHAWILYAYAEKSGWVTGEWHIEIDAFDGNGTLVSTNTSSSRDLTESWASLTVRFRPPANATSFDIRLVSDLGPTTSNGTIYFDTMSLQAIRPHFGWLNGSIAETAVSTGGRSFNWGTEYGQSLVADLLEDGVSGVKGYVYEPYLTTISYPHLLASYYGAGYNLGEAYWASNPSVSWMGVVVGDPKMAPYSDQLHDVHLYAARTNGRLSQGDNGSIEVLLANIGPAEANGWIEVRERIGQVVLSNISLNLPPGDMNNSRQIIQIPVKTQRQGYVEFVVEYVADNGQRLNTSQFVQPVILKERVTKNNQITLNPLVNGPPSIYSFYCSSAIAPRGSTVSCTIFANDEFGIGEVRFAWWESSRGIENGTWLSATSVSSNEYRVSIDIPADLPLGYLWVLAEAIDVDGLVDVVALNDAIWVVDAAASWFGIHAAGADFPGWSGATMLPATSPNGVYRGGNTTLRACVIDDDHSTSADVPRFIASRGEIGSVEIEVASTNETVVICYTAEWWLDSGVPLDPVLMSLLDSSNQTVSIRSIQIDNRAPLAAVNLVRNGSVVGISTAVGESIEVNATDIDDPGIGLSGEVQLSWAGQAVRTIPFSIAAGEQIAFIELPNASAPMSAGSLNVTVFVRDPLGAEVEVSESWLIHRVPPNVTGFLCAFWNGSAWVPTIDSTINRGVPSMLVANIFSHRPLLMSRAALSQSGWSTQLSLHNSEIPEACVAASIAGHAAAEATAYIVEIDSSLIEGEALIEVRATDIDQLQSTFSLAVNIEYPAPTINATWPENFTVGIANNLSFMVKDPDDLDEVICTLRAWDDFGGGMLDLELHPDIFGQVPAAWIPSRAANITLQVICIDGSGQESRFEVSNQTVNPANVEVGDEPKSVGPNEETTESSLAPIIAIGAVFAVMAILVLLVTLLSRRGEDEKWSANIDELVSATEVVWNEPTTLQADPEANQQTVLTARPTLTGITHSSMANQVGTTTQSTTTSPTAGVGVGSGAGTEPTPAALSPVVEGTNRGERVDLVGVIDSDLLSGEQVSDYSNDQDHSDFDLDPV